MELMLIRAKLSMFKLCLSMFVTTCKVQGTSLDGWVSNLPDMHSFKSKSLSEISHQQFSKWFKKFLAQAEFHFLQYEGSNIRNFIYELLDELPNDLRLRILVHEEAIGKFHSVMSNLPSRNEFLVQRMRKKIH